MKQLFLADYVIVTMATSAILIIISYMLLTWTNKTIPTDLIALLGSFGGGSVMSSVFKVTGLKQESKVKLSTVDYALVGLAIAMVTAVINYNLLIWTGREIPSQMIVAINTMVTIVVSGTTFRNSNTVKDDSIEDIDNNN
jgi:hypothetical protein